MSNTIEINLSLKVRNIFGGEGFKAKMNLFQSKVSSSIEVQNSVIQTGMNLKEKIKLFGSINKNNQNNDLRKSSTVIIKNNNEFNSVKIKKEKEKTPEKKNINNIQDKNEEKNREKKLDLKKEISKVKINKNENIKKEEKININANKNNEKKQENKISNINNKDIKKEQIKKEIPIKKENIEKIKEKMDNKTKEIKKEKIGNKSEIKNLEKPKASQIIKKQELIKDKEEKKITENKSNNKFNNKEIQKKETNNIPKIEKKGDKEKNKGMANPKVIEKKVDEKTKVIEKKVEEKPKAIEKKVEEKPKVIEKKVEEKPKVIEKKIKEKSKVIEKKIEEEPKIVEEKVEEKPKVVEKKVEEKPKVVEKKSNIVINNDKKEQEKIEENKKGEINEEKNLGEEYKKKEEVVQEDIKKEEEEIDKNIENEEVNKEKNENEEINTENVDNSEDEWEVIEKTKNEVINTENIENNETKEVKEENVEENVNGEVKKEHFEENVNEEVNEENVEENVNEEVNEENVEENEEVNDENVEENEEVNDENVEEEENEENNEEKDEEIEEQEEIEDNPDENEEENVEENLEEAQNEENEEQYDDNNENVEEKENEEKEEINEEVNNEEKEKEEENEEINDEENNQEVEENIEENNVDNTYEENNTEIKMENNDENDISPKENIENKDSLNQENITDEETYLDEYPYNDEWEYNDNSNEVEIDSDNIYEEIEEKEEENNIESYELETPKEKEDENNIPEEKQEIKEIKEENDSNTNQTNKENIEGDTPNQKNISDNNINENIEKEKEKEDNNNNKEENKLDLDIPKEINKKKRLTEIHNPKKKKIVADLGFEILDNFDNSPQSSSTMETAKDSTNQEILLESIDYESYLTKINQYGKKEISHETFCSGFFLASFPKKNGQVIENLSKFPSSCGHKECSELPPMKPEIIFRYPLKDTKDLELNNLAATICFPTGIKTCYSEEALPEKIEDYVTQITNQKGERYYMRTFHFYEKMSNIDFAKNYEITPLKNHLSKFADEYTFLKDEQYTEEITKNIQKNLKFYEGLGFRDIVYIPCCLCLISKYPYINELGKCLETIYSVIAAKPGLLNFEINDLIMYLINSIPVPGKNMKIEFFIPHCINPKIELQCPKIDDISIMNSNYMGIFKYLSIDNIVLIFRLILAEKKLLFIHNDYTELTNITNSFISLLYPFQWIHTYIPIMSAQMLKYIETFLPFLNGIHISLMNFVEKVFKEGDNDETEEIFLIYIKNNEIVLSSSFKKKGIKLSKYIQSNIPNLPFEKELKKELKIIESSKKQIKKDFLENKLRDAFINIFVKMFYDYEKYIMNLDNDIVFNKVLFMKNIPNKEEKTEQFYEEFIDSQLFQQFTQNLTDKENSYFQKKIKEFKEKENKSNKKAERERTMSKIINKKDILYLAFPYIGLDLDNSEQNKEDINKLESIIEKYKVIPEETPEIKDKILENNIVIKEEAYINNKCIIYLNPDKEDFMKEEQNKNKKIEKKISMAEKQLDQIKDNIKDTVVNIFTSNIEKSQIKSLKKKVFSNLETPSGREFFVSLISNNKNKVISLQENSFFFLGELIKGILNSVLKSEETEELLEEIVKLILSTKYFETGVKTNSKHTKEAKKTIFKCMSKFLHGYSKITQKNLWKKWYDLELIRKKEECSDEDEIKQEVILDICKNMIYFQISKSVVKNVTESINKNAFEEGSELYEKVKKEYISLITKAKYISEASK